MEREITRSWLSCLAVVFAGRKAVHLTIEHLQKRDESWAIVDLFGKGGHIRSVPVPDWVMAAIDSWTTSAKIQSGRLFRAVTRQGYMWGVKGGVKVFHRGGAKGDHLTLTWLVH